MNADGTENGASPNPSSQWLAFELHDGLLQWLISARMKLESQLAQNAAEQISRSEVQAIQVFVTAALEEGRELIGFLEASVSQTHANFLQSIREFVAKLQFASPAHTLKLVIEEEGWPLLPHRTAWNLLRITQQAVNNAIQHAGECSITINCAREGKRLRVAINDTGVGFAADNAATNQPSGHFGLASMQYRSKSIAAELQIASQVGHGTTVAISFPHPSFL